MTNSSFSTDSIEDKSPQMQQIKEAKQLQPQHEDENNASSPNRSLNQAQVQDQEQVKERNHDNYPRSTGSPSTFEQQRKLRSKKISGQNKYHLEKPDVEKDLDIMEGREVACASSDRSVTIDNEDDNYHSRDMEEYGISRGENVVTENGLKQSSFRKRLWYKCLHFCCPFIAMCRAIFRCDMDTLWRIIPSIFVIKALWVSILTLGVCDLARVDRIKSSIVSGSTGLSGEDIVGDNVGDEYIEEAYTFGLWTYSSELHTDHSVEGILNNELERIETCRFHMKDADDGSPDNLFLEDSIFDVARAFAITTVVIGGISMIALWLTAAKARGTGHNKRALGTALLLCCLFESFVFLIFASSVCKDTKFHEHRHCSLQEGTGCIFASCFFWALTGVASFKMPRSDEIPEVESPNNEIDSSSMDEVDDETNTHSLEMKVHNSEYA